LHFKNQMFMYKRRQFSELKSRLEEMRDKIQVVYGPRQVGKSTLVKQVLKEITIDFTFISADNVGKENVSWINEVWETARQRMKLKKVEEYLLVIDEVHKISNWSEAVKKEWDADTFNDVNIKVVLLGSSRLLIKDGLTESLAGRYELIHMSHWSYKEMKEAFGIDLEHYVFFGGYPGGVKFINNETRWRRYIKESIIAPAIVYDILMTKLVYKPELMQQLVELGCTYSGEEIALTKLLGQLQDVGNVTTLASYLSTLKESHLLCGLQKYAKDNARKYNSIPKMLVYNTALLSSLYGMNYSQVFVNPKMWGRWVKSAVGAHLLNMADELDYKLYYWRERNDEVDFILEYNRQCIAIEVKSGRRTTNKGISVFKEKFNPIHTFIVGSGGIPLEDFLSSDLETLFE
jgi:predicted AAA+ superfamily ATPase